MPCALTLRECVQLNPMLRAVVDDIIAKIRQSPPADAEVLKAKLKRVLGSERYRAVMQEEAGEDSAEEVRSRVSAHSPKCACPFIGTCTLARVHTRTPARLHLCRREVLRFSEQPLRGLLCEHTLLLAQPAASKCLELQQHNLVEARGVRLVLDMLLSLQTACGPTFKGASKLLLPRSLTWCACLRVRSFPSLLRCFRLHLEAQTVVNLLPAAHLLGHCRHSCWHSAGF